MCQVVTNINNLESIDRRFTLKYSTNHKNASSRPRKPV